jgi:hypothetical protein
MNVRCGRPDGSWEVEPAAWSWKFQAETQSPLKQTGDAARGRPAGLGQLRFSGCEFHSQGCWRV